MGQSPESLSEEMFLRDMLESSEHILFRLDLVRGGYDYISPIVVSLFAVTLESMHERGLRVLLDELCHSDDVARFSDHILGLCRNSPGQSIRTFLELRLRNAKGDIVWLNNSMTLISSEKGRPLLATGVAIDVTAQRNAEEAVKLSARVFESAQESIIVTDARFNIRWSVCLRFCTTICRI